MLRNSLRRLVGLDRCGTVPLGQNCNLKDVMWPSQCIRGSLTCPKSRPCLSVYAGNMKTQWYKKILLGRRSFEGGWLL